MAQFYTLEEAAQRLNISADEFKRRSKLEWTSIRPFRDGATLRFRAADIDELARSLGEASDPGLQPGPLGSDGGDSSAELPIPTDEPTFSFQSNDDSDDDPLDLGDDENSDDDIFILTSDERGSGSLDSQVRLRDLPEPSGNLTEPTEEISNLNVDLSDYALPAVDDESESGYDSQLGQGDSTDSSSEFELSLDADSDSFELDMNEDDSDEIDLGGLSSISSNESDRQRQSGINLGRPMDSGVSLEKSESEDDLDIDATDFDSDEEIDFELTLDSATGLDKQTSGKLSSKDLESLDDSESEFELTLDDNSGLTDALSEEVALEQQSDIFETDFDLPVVDDDSNASLILDESESEEFEVDAGDLLAADDESASEVVMLDDEDDDLPVEIEDDDLIVEDDEAIAIELDDSESVSRAMRGASRRDAAEPVVRTVAASSMPWGPLPALVLLPTFLVVFLGMLMSYELVRGMWSYQQPGASPGGMLVETVADAAGMETTSNK